MAFKICFKLDEKFVKFEQVYARLGMTMAEMQLEYANLRAEIARKDGQFVNEMAKLKEENRILKCRLMNANNGAGEDEQFNRQYKRSRLEMFPIERIEQQELAIGIEQQQVDSTQEQHPLEGVNNNNENLVHFLQFTANETNGIAIKQEDENTNNNISPGQSEEQREIEQQILQYNQNYYLANQMDESNEVPDGFDQMEEDEEEEDGHNLPGPSNSNNEIGQCQSTTKRGYHEVKIFTDEIAFEQWIQGSHWTKKDSRGKRIQRYCCKFK